MGGPVRNIANQLGVELDDLRQRIEPWYAESRIECKMATVEPGQMAAVRFTVEGMRDGVPVITMEHITRLTAASAPAWEYPPTVSRAFTAWWSKGSPASSSTHTHVSEAGCVSTAARVVNVIDWVCRAPKGLIAVEDIPQADVIRGLMW